MQTISGVSLASAGMPKDSRPRTLVGVGSAAAAAAATGGISDPASACATGALT